MRAPEHGDPILVIRGEHLRKILDGEKSLELRGSVCKKRVGETVFLSESGTGLIMGSAVFGGCDGPLDDAELHARVDEHRVDPRFATRYARVYGWRLLTPQRACAPIPYVVRPGSIVWRRYAPL